MHTLKKKIQLTTITLIHTYQAKKKLILIIQILMFNTVVLLRTGGLKIAGIGLQ